MVPASSKVCPKTGYRGVNNRPVGPNLINLVDGVSTGDKST
jgi:hypothetical protein